MGDKVVYQYEHELIHTLGTITSPFMGSKLDMDCFLDRHTHLHRQS